MAADAEATTTAEETSDFLTVEEIASAADRDPTILVIPEWRGKKVQIRALSYDELAVARQQSWDPRKRETNEDLLNAWCLALGMVQPKIDHLVAKEWICERAFGPVNTILSEVLALSGLGKRAQEAAKSAPEG